MSELINNILAADLTPASESLCILVANNSGEDGWCHLTQSEIGNHFGVSRSAISRRESNCDLIERDGQRLRVRTPKCEAKGSRLNGKREVEGDTSHLSNEQDPKREVHTSHSGGERKSKREVQGSQCEVGNSKRGVSGDKREVHTSHLRVLQSGEPSTLSRQKKVSTPSKKNPTPPSDSPSLRSVESGDGLPEANWDEFFVSPPDDDTQHPAVGCYRSFAETYPSEWDRKRLIDAVGELGTEEFSNRMGLWRQNCEEWKAKGWNWGNFDGLLKRFMGMLEERGLIDRTPYTTEIEVDDDSTAEERGIEHLLP